MARERDEEKEINKIADDAIKFSLNKKKIKKSKVKNIFNLFLEPSTRTTVSFELAAKKLGHNIININFDKSSLSKGETFNDTMATLVSMKPDTLIIREQKEISPKKIYNNLKDKNVLNEIVLYQMPLEELKSFGLSSQKSYYIQNLAYLIYNNYLDLKKLKYGSDTDTGHLILH